ncbi:hypothetical protein IEQ34_022256 [Dendrobium chrysotoxum]|uniref:KIB1-4 beta-propeller domain-containing protein n=1 Tax=Dendrobium chrysotoxum TaxID=161865 RepID=A0AAV7FWL1_DENCH|nr:hypothetical protein IEQ34_022256 [Dendrobium chrysotoxum]
MSQLNESNVRFSNDNNIFNLAIDSNSGTSHDLFISLPFSSSSPIDFFCSSNIWLAFVTRNSEIHHLFNPISNRKLISTPPPPPTPPVYPKMLHYYYKKVKPIAHDSCHLNLTKVVVSSSINSGTAMAGIVGIRNRINYPDRRFVFCRHAYGDCQRWSLLMEGSRGIRDIAFASDGRFYAIGSDWELYMLDERPPLIRLRRIKLWLPKHILGIDHDDDLVENVLAMWSNRMTESGETDLVVYGPYCGQSREINMISLKINVAKPFPVKLKIITNIISLHH